MDDKSEPKRTRIRAEVRLPTGLAFLFGGVLMLSATYSVLGFDFSQSAVWQQIEGRFLLHEGGAGR